MNSKCAFTICSRSYIGMANVLKNSFVKNNLEYDFYIILADTDKEEFEGCLYAEKLLEDCIQSSKYQEMAYKYDVTEFCTSLKPFCLKHFLKKGYELVAYIDPDICFYSKFEELDDVSKSIYLTPHILTMCPNYKGDEKEENFLKYGIYNCGFIAFRNTSIALDVLDWWAHKLYEKSYADAEWGVYTDQKWIDFIPSFVDSNDLSIIKNFGCNVAPWNFYERKILRKEDKFFVTNRNGKENLNKLVFIHFSGFNYNKLMDGVIEHNCRVLSNYEDITSFLEEYGVLLKTYATASYFKYKYKYNFYDDGKPILMLHRRLFRKYLEKGNNFTDLFSPNGGLYNYLSKRKLLINSGSDVKSKNNVSNLDSKRKILSHFYHFCFKVLGVRRFTEFLKALQMYSRFEEQVDNL